MPMSHLKKMELTPNDLKLAMKALGFDPKIEEIDENIVEHHIEQAHQDAHHAWYAHIA